MEIFKSSIFRALLLAVTHISIYWIFSYLIAVMSTKFIGYYLVAMLFSGLLSSFLFGFWFYTENLIFWWILFIFSWTLLLHPIPYFNFALFLKKIGYRLLIISVVGLAVKLMVSLGKLVHNKFIQ